MTDRPTAIEDVTPLSQTRSMTNQLHLFCLTDYEVPMTTTAAGGWNTDRCELDDDTRELGLRRVREARSVLRRVASGPAARFDPLGRNRSIPPADRRVA